MGRVTKGMLKNLIHLHNLGYQLSIPPNLVMVVLDGEGIILHPVVPLPLSMEATVAHYQRFTDFLRVANYLEIMLLPFAAAAGDVNGDVSTFISCMKNSSDKIKQDRILQCPWFYESSIDFWSFIERIYYGMGSYPRRAATWNTDLPGRERVITSSRRWEIFIVYHFGKQF